MEILREGTTKRNKGRLYLLIHLEGRKQRVIKHKAKNEYESKIIRKGVTAKVSMKSMRISHITSIKIESERDSQMKIIAKDESGATNKLPN